MYGGENNGGMIIQTVNFVILIILIVVVIYLYVYIFRTEKRIENDVLSIKSKIGSLIRDLNIVNSNEYAVDVEQSANIKALQSSRR